MTTDASTYEENSDSYQILRLLFQSAVFASSNGGDWKLIKSGDYPGETAFSEYECKSTGARIKVQSWEYANGVPTKHEFTFTQRGDESVREVSNG